MKQQIINILEAIAKQELDKDNGKTVQSATYMDQRILINQVFKGGTYSIGQVILRLTVIDSLYSTNAAYSYFSFEEMAEKICAIGNEQAAQDYFYSVATTGEDPRKLFREPYGIRKNLADGSMQMSLLSKYAYYSLLQDTKHYPLGFPIYDRLAKEAYPTVCKMLGLKKAHSLPALDTPEIGDYIECIGQLRKALFGDSKELFYGYQQYDILDAYLWRMGKFEDGNLSLLLGRTDYIQFVKNLGLEAKANEDDTKYRERMVVKYAETPAVDSKGKFDFNKAVVCNLLKDNNPFKGIGNEAYLNALLQHWMHFHQVKRNK
ncbi:MAG: hypothetical protein K6A67_11235 [Bacteroidales bacterium]|nr:hypothetical protein [Bacteroidales bacterium]